MISSDQIAKNYDIAGVRKANLPGLHMLLLGFFAGMFIALAGAAASVASADITNPSAARIVSALVFPAGLAMVICNGSELFTGNCLMVISLLDHKITFKALMKNYLFVYLGNLIGSLFVSVLFVYGLLRRHVYRTGRCRSICCFRRHHQSVRSPDRIRPRFPGRTCDGYLQRQ